MSTHNICFHGEIRKISKLLVLLRTIVIPDQTQVCSLPFGQQFLTLLPRLFRILEIH